MKKKICVTVISVLILGTGFCYWIYPSLFSPIYTWEINIPVKGESFVTSKLVDHNGFIYWEEKLADPPNYRFGRQIGRTTGGMKIFKITGDSSHDKIMLTGFMCPTIIFKRE